MKLLPLLLILLTGALPLSAGDTYLGSIYPVQCILAPLLKSCSSIETLMPPGTSPHIYEIRPSDMVRIASAAALFSGGENLDEWTDNLESARHIKLLEMVPHSMLRHHPFDTESVDPHFWMDPVAVKRILPNLTDTLARIDPGSRSCYASNMKKFSDQLDLLTARVDSMLSHIKEKKLVLSHHFMGYFLQRFGFEVFEVIEKVPGVEPGPREMAQLINKIKSSKTKAIFCHRQHQDKISQIIAEASGSKIYILDPLGGTPGLMTYSEIILHNSAVIANALKQ